MSDRLVAHPAPPRSRPSCERSTPGITNLCLVATPICHLLSPRSNTPPGGDPIQPHHHHHHLSSSIYLNSFWVGTNCILLLRLLFLCWPRNFPFCSVEYITIIVSFLPPNRSLLSKEPTHFLYILILSFSRTLKPISPCEASTNFLYICWFRRFFRAFWIFLLVHPGLGVFGRVWGSSRGRNSIVVRFLSSFSSQFSLRLLDWRNFLVLSASFPLLSTLQVKLWGRYDRIGQG